MASGRFLTTGHVARVCGVSPVAVKQWIRTGKLDAYQTPGGHYRISAEAFAAFRETYGMPEEAPRLPRVLVVDDEPEVVNAIVDTLAVDPPTLEIATASDGYEGLLKVGTFRPDLLVLDIRMPRIDGFEVCRRVKSSEDTKATRILAISGVHLDGQEENALEAGADAFLAKPFRLDDLRATVGRLLGRPLIVARRPKRT